MFCRVLSILLLCYVTFSSSEKQWGYVDNDFYYGPSTWGKHYPKCLGRHQSPIFIDKDKCREADLEKIKFYFEPGTSSSGNCTIVNNGHSVQVNLKQGRNLRMSGGPLKTPYILEQFHFHWGSRENVLSGKGSEHRIAGEETVAEMHVVTYNSKYYNIKKAAPQSDGLAVFGILFKEDDSFAQMPFKPRRNKNIKKLFKAIQKLIKRGDKNDDDEVDEILTKEVLGNITTAGTKTAVKAKKVIEELKELVEEDDAHEKYFTYRGSLTTPPCYESVRWIVSRKVLEISNSVLKRLRTLKGKDGKAMRDNFRPTQPLNGRSVSCT